MDNHKLALLPKESGVYLMKDGQENILYIGKAKNLRNRVRSYFRESPALSHRITLMVRQVKDLEFIVTDTEAEALALEANLIKKHQPHFNVLLKDDKKYPYLCITWSETYPRIFITRKRRLSNKSDRYYGPYVDSRLLRQTLELIQRVFAVRQRRKPLYKNRTCLNYDLGKCPGVCQGLILPENYRATMMKIAMIFQGRTTELLTLLHSQMEKASLDLNFEKAAEVRDQIRSLDDLFAAQKVTLPDDTISRDAIALAADEQHCCIQLFQIRAGHLVGRLGFYTETKVDYGEILQRVLEEHYRNIDSVEIPKEILVQYPLTDEEILVNWLTEKKGKKVDIIIPQRQNKAELISMVEKNAKIELERTQRFTQANLQAREDLAKVLDLPTLPRRIEGYDISHLQGSNAVASRVVFIDGLPAKQHYRHYKIKDPDIKIGHSDDFKSLQEVIKRRFSQAQDYPDLVMIDGGKGQLSAVCEILAEMDLLSVIKVISLAKKREEIFLPNQSQPLNTDPEQPGVQLLRKVRDEAHRFAITFHRQKRLQQSRISHLDQIPGLGFQRQKQLLAHFHSLDYIRQASLQQLKEVPGIGDNLAMNIYEYFNGQN
jgi:excinuclease ABC subunit C